MDLMYFDATNLMIINEDTRFRQLSEDHLAAIEGAGRCSDGRSSGPLFRPGRGRSRVLWR